MDRKLIVFLVLILSWIVWVWVVDVFIKYSLLCISKVNREAPQPASLMPTLTVQVRVHIVVSFLNRHGCGHLGVQCFHY